MVSLPTGDGLLAGATSFIGGLLNRNATKENNENLIKDKQADRDLQRTFAENGIRWKVQDAERAGIHPLYALGANTVSYAPTSLGTQPASLGSGLAAAGQDISRSMHATRSAGERTDAFTKTVQDLSIQKMGLENQLLSSQIAKLNQTQNPPLPGLNDQYLIPGQGNAPVGPTPAFKDKSADRVPSAPGRPEQEGGAIPDVGFSRTSSGGYMPVPSKDVKERIEDNFMQEVAHMIRNNLMPMMGYKNPPPVPLPKDSPGWVYDPVRGYRPGKKVPYTFGLFRY